MNRGNSKASNALGFISVVTDESGRRIGGLLVINASGRPLEFHCTAPVKSNRAQEILYGPTLDEYLFGEQIGQALHQAMKSDARVLFADSPHVLALRHLVKQPVIYVASGAGESQGIGSVLLRDEHHGQPAQLPQLLTTQRDAQTFGVKFEYEDDLSTALGAIDTMGLSFDICEPFTRIHDAIGEAHGGGRSKSAA